MVFLAWTRGDTCHHAMVGAAYVNDNPAAIKKTPRFHPYRPEHCQKWLARPTHPHRNMKYHLLAGSVKRHCLEKCDEEGKLCDLNPLQPSPASAPAGAGGADPATTVHAAQALPASAVAGDVECEAELGGICAATESILAPVWAEGVDGVSEQ